MPDLKELIVITDKGKAFNIFNLDSIQHLINLKIAIDEKDKILDSLNKVLNWTDDLGWILTTAASLSRFLVTLLPRISDELTPKMVKLLRQVIDNNCIRNLPNLQFILKGCSAFLGSKVVETRQETMRLFISLMKLIDSKEFIKTIIEYINSDDWKIREEMLNLLIIHILNKIDSSFDYEHVVPILATLTKEENAKIRFIAKEALTILATKGNKSLVMSLWGELIVHNEYIKNTRKSKFTIANEI